MTKVLILFLLSSLALAQIKPVEFYLGNKSLKKSGEFTNTPSSNSINSVLSIGDTVWLATSRGLSVTFDGGNTWKNYYGHDDFGEESAIALAFSDGVIYVTTGHHEESAYGGTVIVGSGLRFSTDYGNTWFTVPQSVDDPDDSLIVYGINTLRALPITVPQQNVSYDIAVLNDTIYTTSWAGGLRRVALSDLIQNPNTKWERVVLPPDYLNSISPDDTLHFALQPKAGAFGPEEYLNHVAFSIAVTDSGHIYVGTANGVNKSTDGISWRKFNYQNQIEGISGNFVTSLGYDKTTNSIWATTWQATDHSEFNAISATFDGGQSWRIFLSGETGHGFGFVNKTTSSEVLVATDAGVYRTDNNGGDWFLPVEIRDEITGLVLDDFTKYYSCDATYFSDGTKVFWIGSSQGLAKEMESADDEMWGGKWHIYLASEPLSRNNETYAFPNPFNPSLRQTKIKFFVTKDGEEITIRIYNFDMQIIKTIIQNAPRGYGEQIEIWDGKNENGIYVPNGVYFYIIERGDSEKMYGKIMVIR